MRQYLFTDGSIIEREATETGNGTAGRANGTSLGIGSLRKEERSR